MNNNKKLLWRFELIWWLATAIITIAVIFPIYQRFPSYPFFVPNVVFIVAFITLTRYIFFMRYTFFAELRNLKVALIFLSIPMIFLLGQGVNTFQVYLDENGPDVFVKSLPFLEQPFWQNYILREVMIFSVGATIAAVCFPFRLVVSLWRRHNGYPD